MKVTITSGRFADSAAVKGERPPALVLGTDGPGARCLPVCLAGLWRAPDTRAERAVKTSSQREPIRGVGVADLGYCDLAVAFLLWEPRQRG